MRNWMTAMSVLGFLCGIGSGVIVTSGDALLGIQGSRGPAVFWLSVLILVLGFVAWVPIRWIRMLCGAGLVFVAGFGLWNNGLFFILAGMFTLIAGVLALSMRTAKPELASTGRHAG
jgi:hypothetical protein